MDKLSAKGRVGADALGARVTSRWLLCNDRKLYRIFVDSGDLEALLARSGLVTSLESHYRYNERKQEVNRLSAVFGHCAALFIQLVANLSTGAFAVIDFPSIQCHEHVIDT